MTTIVFAAGAVSVIGMLCGAILAVASKVMYVPADERTEKIRECLPGANCGACGYAGCDGYAAALTAGEGTETNKCTPGGDPVSRQISDILGVDFADVEEQVAVVRCGGSGCATHDKMNYSGIRTCAAAKLFYGGQGACTYSCLGYGDCAVVCPNGAINLEDGTAHVDMAKCSGCGMCARQCPKGIIDIMPAGSKSVVLCSNKDKGVFTRAVCSSGCLGCGRCLKQCGNGAISLKNNLASIDSAKCSGCGACAGVCVTKCIRFNGVSGEGAENYMIVSGLLVPGAGKR